MASHSYKENLVTIVFLAPLRVEWYVKWLTTGGRQDLGNTKVDFAPPTENLWRRLWVDILIMIILHILSWIGVNIPKREKRLPTPTNEEQTFAQTLPVDSIYVSSARPCATSPRCCRRLSRHRPSAVTASGRSLVGPGATWLASAPIQSGAVASEPLSGCKNWLTLRANDKCSKFWYFVKRPYWQKLALELKYRLPKFQANWTKIEEIIAEKQGLMGSEMHSSSVWQYKA